MIIWFIQQILGASYEPSFEMVGKQIGRSFSALKKSQSWFSVFTKIKYAPEH